MRSDADKRTTRLKRGEWNAMFLAAFCALLALSPALAPGAASLDSLAVTSLAAPAGCDAVLAWLSSATAHAAPTASFINGVPAASAESLASLLSALEAAPSSGIETTLASAPEKSSRAAFISLETILGAPPVVFVGAAPQFVASSLSLHEAASLCGIRTNRNLE